MGKKYIFLTGGDGGYGNLGDEWLFQAAVSHYNDLTDKYHVVALTAHQPINPLPNLRYVADNKEAFEALAIPFERIKAVHYYGGGYLNTHWIDEKLWFYDYLVKKGFDKKKIFFTGIGLGPFSDEHKSKLGQLANESPLFGTRDRSFSDAIISQFTFDESIALSSKAIKKRLLPGRELWVNIRLASHTGVDSTRAVILIGQLEMLAKVYRLKIKYFAMIEGEAFSERGELKRLLLRANSRAHVIERAKDYKELITRFKGAALVVTTSYHATLAALYNATPVVSVYENEYYRLKFTGLEDVFDTPLLSVVDLQDYEIDSLLEALKSKDEDIDSKIKLLREANDSAYNTYKAYLTSTA